MPTDHRAKLAAIKRFDQLIIYLRDEMGWPIEGDNFEDVTFEYSPEELGIDLRIAAKIEEIKRLRPLSINQPWGIFFIKFEPKRLPVVALRRILSQVVFKKRASANTSERTAWSIGDLLFISNYGDQEERKITFAHFSQSETELGLPTLKVLGWDNLDTPLHLDDVAEKLTSNLAWPENENDIDTWRESWRSAFLLRHKEVITTSKNLSIRLAQLARSIRDRIITALTIESEKGKLTKLLKSFQVALLHDLNKDSFADMYAQTIAYGLLSARITNPNSKTVDDLSAHMRTNPFLQELMTTFISVAGFHEEPRESGINFDELGINDVVDLLDNSNIEAVVRDFGDRNPEEDPVIHFYEDFLQEYDTQKRMQRGVFYTPRPIVSYIVRSVDWKLKTEFGLEDGLADVTTWGELIQLNPGITIPDGISNAQHFVQILDPATGTGTFLVEVIDLIYNTLRKKWSTMGHNQEKISSLWNDYVPKHLLTRLHGFELLMAPYAIAHLKIGLKLYETGYRFDSEERARIYLTNTLEPAKDFSWSLSHVVSALAHEAKAVNDVKVKQRFTVIIGNPPYAGTSANLYPFARSIIEKYRFVGMQRIVERGALQFEKNLQDDYVKFIAWSEAAIEMSGVGILSLITNHGFIDTPTLRGMRWHLLKTFTSLSFWDLHGSLKRHIPGDEPVFDIQQGVAISLLVKGFQSSRDPIVRIVKSIGSRIYKYNLLLETTSESTESIRIIPCPPFFKFLKLDTNLQAEYNTYPRITEIMPFYSTGTETGFDELLVDFTMSELVAKLQRFLDPQKDNTEVKEEFGIKGGTALKLLLNRDKFRNDFDEFGLSYIRTGMYRVFDNRVYYYKKEYLKTNSFKVMKHLMHPGNIALVAFRQQSKDGFNHIFITNQLSDKNSVSLRTREVNCYFPLIIRPEVDNALLQANRIINIDPGYLNQLYSSCGIKNVNDEHIIKTINPRRVIGYIYAVCHSLSYRIRYGDFLKSDFPRIPLPGNFDFFKTLSRLGSQLVSIHLMESPILDDVFIEYIGPENPLVERVTWSDNVVWLSSGVKKKGHQSISGTIGFHNVPEEVWNFQIGGYQVCEKWLKDRKGRTLSKEEILHYKKIIVALSKTIRIMCGIDEVIEEYGGWPSAFHIANESSDSDIYAVPKLKQLEPNIDNRFITSVPLIQLKVAAGSFGDPQYFEDEEIQWVEIATNHKLRPGMFVIQVVGHSMEPLIPNGSYCLFSSPVEGSRHGKTVLVQLSNTTDPETGNQYTVKRYYSDKMERDGSWTHTVIRLKPQNPEFKEIILEGTDQNEYRVIAEFVEVVRCK